MDTETDIEVPFGTVLRLEVDNAFGIFQSQRGDRIRSLGGGWGEFITGSWDGDDFMIPTLGRLGVHGFSVVPD